MISFLQKHFLYISLALLTALIASLFFYPAITGWLSLILLVSSLCMASLFTIQKHIDPYKHGRITRLSFMRNVLLDTFGLLLTIAAASYIGGMAGTRLGGSFGLWAGLLAGIGSAFLVAWLVRKIWGKVSAAFMG